MEENLLGGVTKRDIRGTEDAYCDLCDLEFTDTFDAWQHARVQRHLVEVVHRIEFLYVPDGGESE